MEGKDTRCVVGVGSVVRSNNSVERDRPQAALVGSLRGFAAPAAHHVKRYAGRTKWNDQQL